MAEPHSDGSNENLNTNNFILSNKSQNSWLAVTGMMRPCHEYLYVAYLGNYDGYKADYHGCILYVNRHHAVMALLKI